MRRTVSVLPFLLVAMTPILADDRQPTASGFAKPARPIILVKVTELSGIGPDSAEALLFQSTEGFTTTYDALGRVGYEVTGSGLKDGGYHTLHAHLAEEYEVIASDGSRSVSRFKPGDTEVRVRGMLVVEDGQVSPLRMLNDAERYRARQRRRYFREGGDED